MAKFEIQSDLESIFSGTVNVEDKADNSNVVQGDGATDVTHNDSNKVSQVNLTDNDIIDELFGLSDNIKSSDKTKNTDNKNNKEDSTVEKKVDSKKNADNAQTSDSSSSPFVQLAKVLSESGIIAETNDEDLNKLVSEKGNTVDVIVSLAERKIDDIIKEYKKSAEEDYKLFLDARENGVALNEFTDISSKINKYKNITDEQLEKDEDLCASIIRQDFKSKGISDEEINDDIEAYTDTNKLLAKAKTSLRNVRSNLDKEFNTLKENARKKETDELENYNRQREDFKKLVNDTDELLPNIKLNSNLKKKIIDNVLEPYSKTRDGQSVNKIEAKRLEDPAKFVAIQALLVEMGVFDGKGLDKMTKFSKTDTAKELEKILSGSDNKSGTQQTNTNKKVTSWSSLVK